MARDPAASPVEVFRRYRDEIWARGLVERLPEIVADPYRRHYPGKVETVTNDELAERVRYYRRGLRDVRFTSVLEVCEGPYLTTVWETNGYTQKDDRYLCTSGIEVFKVAAGLITDVWNGHADDGRWAWNLRWDRAVDPRDAVDVQGRVREWGVVDRQLDAGDT